MIRLLPLILFLSTEILFSQSIDPNINDFVIDLNKTNNLNQNQTVNQYIQNNNIVKITQIGNYNQADLTLMSSRSNVTAEQTGNNNYINVYKHAAEINQSFVQNGNNNFISDFSLYSSGVTSMKIQQEGNNLSLYNNGSNSISKDLIINQTGNSGTVYLFNR